MAISQYELVEPAQQVAALRQIRTVRRKIVLQITALGLVALAIPLSLIFSQVQNELAQLDRELATLQDRLTAASTPSPQAQTLTAQLNQIESLYSSLSAVAPPLGVQWPAVVAAIDRYDRQHITVVSLTQSERRLVLEGRATDNTVVVRYLQDLTASPLFASVEIESMTLMEAATTATAPGDTLEERQPVQFRLALVINQEKE
ncbi:MAG TPA: PilN domain-containing protein [Caldilineaceae bacterium]|nr:PilN domain-containing protein [Caldilineaceae bacterium]